MRRRLGRRIAIGSAIAVVAAFVLMIVGRVAVLQTALDAALAAYGVSDARYRIASVGLRGTRISDIQLGEELAIADLSLRYRPWRLLGLEVEEIAVAGLRLDLSGLGSGPPGPLARLMSGGGAASDRPARLPPIPPLHIADGFVLLPAEITVSMRDVRWSAADDGAAHTLALSQLEIARAEQRVALRGLTARVAAELSPSEEPIARFEAMSIGHEAAEPFVAPLALAGEIARDDRLWRLAATASDPRGARFTGDASYDGAGRSATARITLPVTRFVAGGLQPGDVVPALTALTDVSGAVAGHVGLRWSAGRKVAEAALRIDDLRFTVAGVPVDGLTARLGVSAEGASMQPVVRIEQARLAMAGGTVVVPATTLRPLADTNRIVLRASGLDLARVLAGLDLEGVSGEGRIDGALPLVLAAGTVAVDSGTFEAQGPGVLRIASQDTAAALAQGGEDATLLLQALTDFHYDRLALTVDKPLSGESRLTLSTYGRNPLVLDGHPFQINVTVTTNLDRILSVVAEGGRLWEEIIRAIVGTRQQ